MLNTQDRLRWDLLSEYWNKRMGEEGDWYSRNVLHPAVLEILGDVRNLQILDAGCSTGSLSRFLAKKGARVVGVDYSMRMIDFALQWEKEKPLNIEYQCCQLEKLSQKLQKKFDFIIADFVFQDFKKYQKLLNEMKKMLSRNGRLVVIIEHPCFSILDFVHVTTERKWINCKVDNRELGHILARYVHCNRSRIFWEDGLWTNSYHHTLEEYSNTFRKLGFVISRLVEPLAPVEITREGPPNNISHKIPLFLLIETFQVNKKS